MTDNRMNQAALESYLWGAAVLLRGLIDAGDYKGYIFPLVFLKRISDVWDEERATALGRYDGDEELADLPENHRFIVPVGEHWNDIRATTTNVGRKLVASMRAIESANPDTLNGVFGDAEWTNKDLLSDATLIGLVEHFSSKTLSLVKLPEDELGNGYEFLIKRFADDSDAVSAYVAGLNRAVGHQHFAPHYSKDRRQRIALLSAIKKPLSEGEIDAELKRLNVIITSDPYVPSEEAVRS